MSTYTRDDLIRLCEQAIVPHDKWRNRDSPSTQEGIGKAWAFLRAGCDFHILTDEDNEFCVTDERTIWVEITHDHFGTFDWGGEPDRERFYLPTEERLRARAGRDWY